VVKLALTNEKIEEINRLWDSYFFPGTNILRNKLNIHDNDELKQKEAEITFEKLVDLYIKPIQGNFDSEHWKNIHKYLFEDIYDWAGEYRYVNMRKETGFTEVQNIGIFLDGELELMNQGIKSVYSTYSLAMFIAEYYVHLMEIHPFREGNGRSCREFLRQFVAEKTKNLPCGPHELDWTRFDGDVILNNVQFSMVFRGQIEMEFLKALVPLEKEEINEIKM
jgi:cell filamentation protein